MVMPDLDPLAEYRSRLARLRAESSRLAEVYTRIAFARLGTVLVAVVMTWLRLVEGWLSGLWLFLPLGVFMTLAVVHSRIAEKQGRVRRAIAFYDLGTARIEDQWMGRGQTDLLVEDDGHLYASDLDIFGRGSLFELISTARTRTGQETLARWLLQPAEPAEIRARQQAVEELRSMLDLREDLATLGSDVVTSIHPDSLVTWGEAPDSLTRRWPRFVAPVLAVVTAAAVAFVLVTSTRAAWLFRDRVGEVLAAADRHGREFQFLSQLIQRIESRSFASPKLVALQSSIQTAGLPPSQHLKRFARLGDFADMRRNMMFTLMIFLLAMTQVAFALEAWRRVCGPALSGWLSAIGQFEALSALAGYAYEHPRDPFPEIVDTGPVFEGHQLGHPLLPSANCIPNDVHLGAAPQMMVVSGSNMSGKSTLLRTVGINTVLALAGAPVRAGKLRLSPLSIGATLRIQDSLQEGTSRFYAEIQRIRQIVGLASEGRTVLFLLDEVLNGTNSHDRSLGADGILRGLIRHGAIGLATTHDLALTRIANDLGEKASNVHFEDRLEGDTMVFDYRMRPGVVEKSNALELMRALGLEV
jgi:hypothetical protein